MTNGQFQVGKNQVNDLLRLVGMFKEREMNPNYRLCTADRFRNKSYIEIWNACYVDKLFDFSLFDNSLLQFQYGNDGEGSATYHYLECPYELLPSWEE